MPGFTPSASCASWASELPGRVQQPTPANGISNRSSSLPDIFNDMDYRHRLKTDEGTPC